jgi:hypothetical protein
MERAYYKYLQQAKVARAKGRKNLTERERAEMKSLHNTPSPPVQQQTVEAAPENP